MLQWILGGETPQQYFARLNKEISDPAITSQDVEMTSLCQHYAVASPEERAKLRRCPPSDKLLLFAQRMATKAMRTKSPEYIRLGLFALSVEDQQLDFRDSTGIAFMLSHAASYIATDFLALAEEAASLSSDPTAQLFGTIAISRDATLGQYCLQQTTDENGVMIAWRSAP